MRGKKLEVPSIDASQEDMEREEETLRRQREATWGHRSPQGGRAKSLNYDSVAIC
jgi:hypothetical protein